MPKYGITYKLPAIIGLTDYKPTTSQLAYFAAYVKSIESNTFHSPGKLCRSIGIDKSNFSKWRHNSNFMQWFDLAQKEYWAGRGLQHVYRSVFDTALTNNPQAQKLYLERFDSEYRPVNKTEIESYRGRVPPAGAIDRSKERVKALQSQGKTKLIESKTISIEDDNSNNSG